MWVTPILVPNGIYCCANTLLYFITSAYHHKPNMFRVVVINHYTNKNVYGGTIILMGFGCEKRIMMYLFFSFSTVVECKGYIK